MICGLRHDVPHDVHHDVRHNVHNERGLRACALVSAGSLRSLCAVSAKVFLSHSSPGALTETIDAGE